MPRKQTYPKRHPDILPVHPGELLREDVVPALQMSVSELARSLGVTDSQLRAVLAEKKPVTAELAVRLAAAFKPSAEFWLRLQASYDLWHAQRNIDTSAITALQAAE